MLEEKNILLLSSIMAPPTLSTHDVRWVFPNTPEKLAFQTMYSLSELCQVDASFLATLFFKTGSPPLKKALRLFFASEVLTNVLSNICFSTSFALLNGIVLYLLVVTPVYLKTFHLSANTEMTAKKFRAFS